MRHGENVRLILAFCAALASGQQFPMRYLGEIGHLEPGQTVDLGIAKARGLKGSVQVEGADQQRKPWRIAMTPTGGIGWTTVWSADFDADGQKDLLIGQHFPGVGRCIDGASILVVLFDQNGRPVPWSARTNLHRAKNIHEDKFPCMPVLVMDADRNGRAEFVLTDCELSPDGATRTISAIHEAHAARVVVVARPSLAAYRKEAGMPAALKPKGAIDDPRPPARVEELIDTDSAWQLKLSDGRAPEWPGSLVIDAPAGREIYPDNSFDTGLPAVLRVMRDGYPVKLSEGWLWADAFQPALPAKVEAGLVITSSQRIPVTPMDAGGGCFDVMYEGNQLTTIRTCPGKGILTRSWGGSHQEFLPDRRTVRTSHSAMQIIHTTETRYEQPPGALYLMATADGRLPELTQWRERGGGSVFALHADGPLVAAQVHVPVNGDLAAQDDGLVFLTWSRGKPESLLAVRYRLRWRRV